MNLPVAIRLTCLALLLLTLPCITCAQDTALVKKQAQRFASASFNGDFKTVTDLTYPKLVALSGGRDEMQKLISERIEGLKKQGIIQFSGSVGSPGKFYKAGTQIHCLLPETIILKMFNGHYVSRSYLLAISNDMGKSWAFMDVGKMPPEVLYKLLPDYNDNLVIPTPGKPMFFTD
ncbi:hypothetical protein [Mucilaginibacter phyllosphaerae]|uniref:Uncharacterized protein n=1 Tax=Mucilaginibacter phyllosphaerae TaxID=1812349 RepID=A0A4Y8AJ22_9SPHI|nr:hypothetical protein [Mucilaginibacter phyllosphaerae]MBB3967912.1 hypothetical protein [Mucilaginibacter phyllosphaerae]TEW69048.1 hypothetical protein E2R65_02470 [Mucilaginibacter phyllosphaerae]GGH02460.1 hypothetical protein GCM10007352_04720 [Mucilaginibacter phyllosphaerae]